MQLFLKMLIGMANRVIKQEQSDLGLHMAFCQRLKYRSNLVSLSHTIQKYRGENNVNGQTEKWQDRVMIIEPPQMRPPDQHQKIAGLNALYVKLLNIQFPLASWQN